jgi:hypothetical protein
MYKIIGANQVEYGPISADQLRAWIAEGRVNAQTMVQAEGDTSWKPLSMFPEFAVALPTAPPPMSATYGSPDGRERALSAVTPPAICLLVTAILGILVSLLRLCLNLLGLGMAGMDNLSAGNPNPEVQHMIVMLGGAAGIVIFVLATVLWGIVLWGSLKMKKLENYGLCIAASIIAMIPCLCPCCLLGLPFGIWALVVLSRADVKQNFT